MQSRFGRLESQFLAAIAGAQGNAALEPYDFDCVKVWHTKTAVPKLDRETSVKAHSRGDLLPNMEV